MTGDLERVLREERDKLLSNPVSPRVDTPTDINRHYCRYVAETVVERVGDELDVEIIEDGGRGYVHTWVHHDGRHYDAECVQGVDDYHHLPFFERHPEAAVNVEPGAVDPAALRRRGLDPVHPAGPAAGATTHADREDAATHVKLTIADMAVGIALFGLGLLGEWVARRSVLDHAEPLRTLFVDVELLGEFVILMSPIVFLLILPAHRAARSDPS